VIGVLEHGLAQPLTDTADNAASGAAKA
jgi:hypothetical protein